jgi:glutamyl-tRNA(Gln) amidotransferase subunit E
LPEMPEQKMERLTKTLGLNQKLAKQILDSEYALLFESLVKETKISPTVIAAILTETFKGLKREGVELENVTDRQIHELFRLIESGQTVKEAVPDIVSWIAKHEGASVNDALIDLKLEMLTEVDVEKLIDGVILENKALVDREGEGTFGALMGLIMKKVRGRANAELVSSVLRRKLRKAQR